MSNPIKVPIPPPGKNNPESQFLGEQSKTSLAKWVKGLWVRLKAWWKG